VKGAAKGSRGLQNEIMNEINENGTARLATIDRLRATTLPIFLDPVPARDTLRAMFDRAGIPRFKSNPSAKRGGGSCFYSVAHVERLFRTRTVPGSVIQK